MTKTNPLLDSSDPSIYEIETHAAGPSGKLPLTDDILRTWSSGDLFGLTQAAGMGWKPEEVQKLVLVEKTADGERRDRVISAVRFVPLTRDSAEKVEK